MIRTDTAAILSLKWESVKRLPPAHRADPAGSASANFARLEKRHGEQNACQNV